MRRRAIWLACLIVILFATTMPAQAQFSIRAASAEPVEGWQRMQVEHSDRVVWVAPTAAVIASDIEKAQPEVRADGYTVIAVVFTDAGAEKLRDFTRAQMNKLVAMVVDGRVIWAPLVRAEFSKEAVLTGGNTGHGLTQDEVDRIMASLR